MVIAIMIVVLGLIAIRSMPIEQYPDITPPVVEVSAEYLGADALTIEQSVATPLEESVNGVSDMIYMQSTNSNNGSMSLQVSFAVGTDPDMNTIFTQNRVSSATPMAPAGRHQARSHDRENDEQFHSGTVALLGRQIRRKLLGQLRDPAYQGPAGADQRRGKRPGHGRRRLCDAHLGQARPNGLSGSDRRRHRFGHRTAERGDTRRPARRRA